MDTQAVAMEGAQQAVLDQVAVSMLSKSLKGEEAQSAEVLKSLAPLPAESGARIDLFA